MKHKIGMIMIAIALLAACAGANQKPACQDLTLTAIGAECTARIVSVCKKAGGLEYEECKARGLIDEIEADCDKRIDEWEACGQ